MKNWMILCTLALLLAGCAKDNTESLPDTLSPDRAAATGRAANVPFKATYETAPEVVDPPPILKMKIPGKGKGLHLGKSTWFSNSIVDFTGLPAIPPQQTGDMVFTAADGSTLVGHYWGIAYPDPDDPQGVFYNGDYLITGGTGRFEGATGNGIYYGHATLEAPIPGVVGEGVVTFEGELNKP
ncbi:MAG: hypothetical protein L6Q97_03355 [Thermoanaerobaculia bacterium]|nr:hypothetical protein [Thermoanaerobaculia bacterium]